VEICYRIDDDKLKHPTIKAANKLMQQLEHEEYVKMRLLIIDNPICEKENKVNLANQFRSNPIANELLNQVLYEEVPEDYYLCKNCGWTMTFHGRQAYCADSSCAQQMFLHEELMKDQLVSKINKQRLKKEIMHFIALPGVLEKQIFKLLTTLKLQYVPYPAHPYNDTYDAEIFFADGERWYLDAKSYKKPRSLGENLVKELKEKDVDADRLYYVIPNRCDTNFKSTVNSYLESLPKKGRPVCITLKDLKTKLKTRRNKNEK
jgi:hypothetical protein